MTPTARSTQWLRDLGWIVAKVEQRLYMPEAPYPVTRDAFGFGDLLAAHPRHKQIMLVQATGGQGGNLMARVHKIIEGEKDERGVMHLGIPLAALDWIRAGGVITCHGWAKRKPRGVKRPQWTLKIKRIELFDNGKNVEMLRAVDVELDAMK